MSTLLLHASGMEKPAPTGDRISDIAAASSRRSATHSVTLALLRETYGAKILLDIEDVAEITGVKSKTIRNKIPAEWPIQAQLVQGRWRMHIVAVAEAIDSGALDFYRRRRRGRPRKDAETQQSALA